ncbi:MAG: hypothetical protein RLZZ485_1034, partial [Actinomycetota bacterium]
SNEISATQGSWSLRWGESFYCSENSTSQTELDLWRKRMIKYEYATVPLLTHATKQILDTWGSDGWELVQVVPAPGGGDQLVAYMKRALA